MKNATKFFQYYHIYTTCIHTLNQQGTNRTGAFWKDLEVVLCSLWTLTSQKKPNEAFLFPLDRENLNLFLLHLSRVYLCNKDLKMVGVNNFLGLLTSKLSQMSLNFAGKVFKPAFFMRTVGLIISLMDVHKLFKKKSSFFFLDFFRL